MDVGDAIGLVIGLIVLDKVLSKPQQRQRQMPKPKPIKLKKWRI